MRELAFIEQFLKENHAYVCEKYHDRKSITVTAKEHAGDLLTEVDLTIQHRFVERVQKAYPEDRIVGEEAGFSTYPKNRNQRAWVIDPIDGTYNFMRGIFPIFGISIAFVENGRPQAGGVLLPMADELFLAERGSGSFQNGRRLQVSHVQHLNEACLEFDFSNGEDRRAFLDQGKEVLMEANMLRSRGAAVVSICQIATGDIDGYLHLCLKPWDYAASQLIVEEAGGMATRLDGGELHMFEKRLDVLFSNGAIHDELIQRMR